MTDLRQLVALTSGMMLLSERYVEPQPWRAANDTTKPPRKATKNRSKIKAARKQKAKRK